MRPSKRMLALSLLTSTVLMFSSSIYAQDKLFINNSSNYYANAQVLYKNNKGVESNGSFDFLVRQNGLLFDFSMLDLLSGEHNSPYSIEKIELNPPTLHSTPGSALPYPVSCSMPSDISLGSSDMTLNVTANSAGQVVCTITHNS